ncbi:MAG: DUF2971 domain-containing protein [Nitrososphaera sp.]|nr:DUF2971 domain-containing protein [Nitrososphaera sp.]
MNIPLSLHRYVRGPSGSKYSLQALEQLVCKSQLRVSRPTTFNDPFDFRALFSSKTASRQDIDLFLTNRLFGTAKEKPTRLIKEMLRAAEPDPSQYAALMQSVAHESTTRYLEGVRVVCFCEPGRKGHPENLLLWSYYAEGHKGMCLEFDTKALLTKTRDCLFKVDYRTEYPSLSEYSQIDEDAFHKLMLFTKSKHWDHEQEWRLVVDRRYADNEHLLLPKGSLKSITFGCLMPEHDKELIYTLLASSPGSDVEIFEACRSIDSYELSFWKRESLPNEEIQRTADPLRGSPAANF